MHKDLTLAEVAELRNLLERLDTSIDKAKGLGFPGDFIEQAFSDITTLINEYERNIEPQSVG